MGKQNVVKRRQGYVSALNIELLTHQKQLLDEYSEKLGMTKADIIAQALNMWFGAMNKVNKE